MSRKTKDYLFADEIYKFLLATSILLRYGYLPIY